PEAAQADLSQALHHLAGDVTRDDSLLEGITVDQHRRLQRPEAGHAYRVEHPCSRPAKVDLAGSHGAHHLLLGVGGVVTPLTCDLDTNVAARTLVDPRHEVLDRGDIIQVAVRVGHPQHHRLTGAASLVAGAGRA